MHQEGISTFCDKITEALPLNLYANFILHYPKSSTWFTALTISKIVHRSSNCCIGLDGQKIGESFAMCLLGTQVRII